MHDPLHKGIHKGIHKYLLILHRSDQSCWSPLMWAACKGLVDKDQKLSMILRMKDYYFGCCFFELLHLYDTHTNYTINGQIITRSNTFSLLFVL